MAGSATRGRHIGNTENEEILGFSSSAVKKGDAVYPTEYTPIDPENRALGNFDAVNAHGVDITLTRVTKKLSDRDLCSDWHPSHNISYYLHFHTRKAGLLRNELLPRNKCRRELDLEVVRHRNIPPVQDDAASCIVF